MVHSYGGILERNALILFFQLCRMHPGAVSCLTFSDEQLLVTGSSHGCLSISDLSSDQWVVTLDTSNYAGSCDKTFQF